MGKAASAPGRGFGRSFLVRLAVSALLLICLCAAWGSGLDRLSVMSPALERLVPGPFRANADRSAAAVALARGDGGLALAHATEAVLHDPLDPLSDSILGSAREYRGDSVGGEAAFRIAATRGWRDRLTQLYWYGVAVEGGDAERAALRADALLRADPLFAAGGSLLAPLEASPAGRAALARRLAENPGWAADYFTAPVDFQQAQLKSEVALLAVQQDSAFDCATPRPLVAALLKQGLRREAERLWRAACGSSGFGHAAEGEIVDAGFTQVGSHDTQGSPFGWQAHASGDVAIEPAGTGRHARLNLRNSAAVSRLVLSQAVALAPGRYRLHVSGGAPAGRIALSLDCGSGSQRPANTEGDPATVGQILEIGTCDSQLLGLWLRPGVESATINNMTIDKLP